MKKFHKLTTQNFNTLRDINVTITDSLQEGFESFETYFRQPNNTQPIDYFFSALTQHIQQEQYYFSGEISFKENQDELYNIIYNHTNKFTMKQKLFFEFLIGLCRFKFCLIMTKNFIVYSQQKIGSTSPSSIPDNLNCNNEFCQTHHSFWKEFHTLSNQVITGLSQLLKITNQFKNDSFWKLSFSFFNNYPILKKLATQLVSIQFIPKEETEMMSIAQTLHWGGFGGDGNFIKNISQLIPLLPHCIGYHGKESGGFNNRLQTILTQQKLMTATLSKKLIKLLPFLFKRNSIVNILDLGSGPKHLGANPVIK